MSHARTSIIPLNKGLQKPEEIKELWEENPAGTAPSIQGTQGQLCGIKYLASFHLQAFTLFPVMEFFSGILIIQKRPLHLIGKFAQNIKNQ